MNNLPNNPEINAQNLKPFTKFCMTIGVLPSSYLTSLTYEEQLLWFCDFLENQVIPTVNNNASAVTELQNLYIELKNYVDNYFTNLDVQNEINNKLDAMAQDGTLQEIISSYLNSKAIFCFDNVASMKSSTNLINGSFAKTLGFYNINDNGGALYKIRTSTGEEEINNMSIILLNNNLVAELIIQNQLNLKQLGAKNDEDVSSILQFAINTCKEKYDLIIDDYYLLNNSITIDKPIVMRGLPSIYSNFGACGFKCNNENDIVYFNFDEGSVNCLIERITFINNGIGTCIKFSSRDEKLTNYRVWKNQFNKCQFNNFNKGLLFYAVGDVTDYDYSSEMLFIDCKFYNNIINCEYDNVQSYNTNFIATDFECLPEKTSIGFILNSYGGININGGSIILHNSLIKLGENESLVPVNSFKGIVNISNCRFETFEETIFDYTLSSRNTIYQQHSLNINNTDFYTHNPNATLIDTNVRGLKANMNISLTGSNNLLVNGQNQQSASDFSTIIINTAQPERITVNYNHGEYTPWIILNGNIKSCCVANQNNNNYFEYNNKLYLGFNKFNLPFQFNINIPWRYRKFVININGEFINNTGNITISNSSGFTYTFTKNVTGYSSVHDEVYLPYNSDDTEYTIKATNIWGNCYFE